MRATTRSRLESIAHLLIVAALTISMGANFIMFIVGSQIAFSPEAAVFGFLSVVSWLFLAGLTVFLNIAGSVHRRFSFCAMLLTLIGVIVSALRVPAVT